MLKFKTLGFVLAILLALAAGSLVARWAVQLGAPPSQSAQQLDPSAPANTAPAALSTDTIITALQGYLKNNPSDSVALSNLGIWYAQKARETGDPAFYTHADGALNRALQLDPNNFRTLTGLGALALSRHQFRQGLAWGQRALPLNTYNSGIYGVIGDAQLELGMYDQAFATFQKMVDLRPDLTSYARISYARELSGDLPGAVEAMQRAAEAGAPNSEAVAWAEVQLGNLYFGQNDYADAEQAYQAALASFNNYSYARAGIANLRAAQGDYAGAIDTYTGVIRTMPLPQFVIALGDIYAAAGRPADAAREYALVQVEEKLFQANGVDVDAELALFDADHNLDMGAALDRARTAYADRPSVTVADVLAWTLYKRGDYAEAQTMMKQALRLGSRNALMYYHAGMIAYQMRDPAAAMNYLDEALSLDPHFSLLYDAQAKQLLAQLRGQAPTIQLIGEEH